ncbi:hypothetical protein ABVK25_009276 [Lepraria finkii]|uniref:Uncharacterized protein n=1 Tax=Lepraria finkii TaxID=1340010 RepID=A0ABR4AXQ1_9LECA
MDLEDLAGDAVNVLNATTNSQETVEIQLPQPNYQPQCALYILRDTTWRLPVPSDFPAVESEAQGQRLDNVNLHGRM